MSENLKVAIYARVSRKDQHAENQLLELREYCRARRWIVQREFVDLGMSGAKKDRPSLEAALDFMRHRKADIFLVWKYDRMARNARHLLNTLYELKEIGAHFASYTEQIDTTTAQGRLQFNNLANIAEFERDILIERIHSGLDRVRAEGKKHFGRPRVDQRADFDRDKLLQIRAQGRSLRQIEAETGISIATLSRLFQKGIEKVKVFSDGTDSPN